MSSVTHVAAATPQPRPNDVLMQLGGGYMIASCLHVTTKLAIPDLLAQGTRPVSELAQQTGVQEDALYRVMRFLASMEIYHEVGLRHFRLTPMSDLLRSDHPESMRAMILFITNSLHAKTYGELMHSLRTGQPCVEKVTGMPVFDYFSKGGEVTDEFNAAMTNLSEMAIPPVLEVYDFSGIETLVDVAGGHGKVTGFILQKYPEMRAIIYDLPEVIAGTGKHLAAWGVADRCQTISGDMFKSVPAGDSYIMKNIIHDWDDEKCTKILKNCVAAMTNKTTGRVILIESVVQPVGEPDYTKLVDVEMLAMPGGRERTEEEFAELFNKAGLRLERVVPAKGPMWVVEARVAR